jgi:DNA polymerase I
MRPLNREAYDLLHQGAIALAQIEANGMRIDTAYLDQAREEVSGKIKILQAELRSDPIYDTWRKRYKDKMQLGSRQQLRTVVQSLGYAVEETTDTGKDKADEASFSKIDLPFVKDYFACEKLKKVRGTYLDGIKRETVNGLLHPFFHLNTVKTWRSSSSDPNFQNLPIRNEEMGAYVRKCFIPRAGNYLVEMDYKSAEVRVGACYHKDPMMLEYVSNPQRDMHKDCACDLFFLELNEVDKTVKNCVKGAFVFAEFYGDYYIHCAKNLWDDIDQLKLKTKQGHSLEDVLLTHGITELGDLDPKQRPRDGTFEKHVKAVEEDFWGRRFKGYAAWKKKWYENYLKTGGFDYLTGFRAEGLFSRNECNNHPIQGGSFHCLLWALIRLQKWLVKNNMKSKIIGQVHDSINADVHPSELQDYLHKAREIVEHDLPLVWDWLITPIPVEVEVSATNWHEKKQWIDKGGIWVPA